MPDRIVISVGIASHPICAAGNTWYSLGWALGFRDLGWDVWIVEAVDSTRCVDAHWRSAPIEESANKAYWDAIIGKYGFEGRATLLADDCAPGLDDARDFAAASSVFLNLSGHFKTKAIAFPKATRIYLDADPAFTQIWSEAYGCDMNYSGHDVFFSVGQNLGKPGTLAPTNGIEWRPTLPPVVLSHWPFQLQPSFGKFTTVAHWRGYNDVEWQGRSYSGKAPEFERILSLPRVAPGPIEVATGIRDHEGELGPMRENGWLLADAESVCSSMISYADYLRHSSAEFSVAKGGYAVARCGWFSDRSVCYAACGRPLVVQDTGLEGVLPLGEGIHVFNDLAQARRACERVIEDFESQQRKARALAENFFDSKKVISSLLSRI